MHKPSDLHSCLTEEKINILGKIIANSRADNLEHSDERDNGWSLGCRGHTWVSSDLVTASSNYKWLSIIDPGLKFKAAIEGVPFGFFKGSSKKPKKNLSSRVESHPSLRQNAFEFDEPIPEELVWLFAIEIDLEGSVTNIEFFGMSKSQDVVASHTVPLLASIAKLVSIPSRQEEPKEIPPAHVSIPSELDESEIDSK